jgi:hypothetical protein
MKGQTINSLFSLKKMERLAISFSEVLHIHDLMFGGKCVRLSLAARRYPSAKSVLCRKEREERERERVAGVLAACCIP